MKANYNAETTKSTGRSHRRLTGDKAVYKFMPTCAFEIGDITVDKEGGVTCEDADKLERLIHNSSPTASLRLRKSKARRGSHRRGTGSGRRHRPHGQPPAGEGCGRKPHQPLTAKESLIKKASH